MNHAEIVAYSLFRFVLFILSLCCLPYEKCNHLFCALCHKILPGMCGLANRLVARTSELRMNSCVCSTFSGWIYHKVVSWKV